MRNEEIESCIQTLRFLENNFINDHGIFLNDKNPDNIEKIIKFLKDKRWIPCSERLPKENEYIGNVCKYYLVQDEYGDMHVAHLSNAGWIPMHSLKAIGDEVIAWMPLPQSYKAESEVKE